MKKGQAHPAALTSKKMLSEALIELMKKKEYKSITITEVCNQSQIARRTFYRNFEVMEDVLVFSAKNIIEEFSEEMNNHITGSYYDVLLAFFSFWKNYKDFMILLNQNGLVHIIFTEYIKSLEQNPFLCYPKTSKELKPEEIPCLIAFTAGGLWSLLTYWISNDCKQSPEELAKIITNNYV